MEEMENTFALEAQGEGTTVAVRFAAPRAGGPDGKVADAELVFTGGVLHGLKLVGLAVWRRRDGRGFNATMPVRSYLVGGERRSFALLRPEHRDGDALIVTLSAAIAKAYARWAR